MKIKLMDFAGEFPKADQTRLRENAATIAQDVDFTSGALKPFYAVTAEPALPALPSSLPTQDIERYYSSDTGYWMQFPSHVDVISSPIKDDWRNRVYWSGDSRDAEGDVLFSYTPDIYEDGAPYPNHFYKLGIPAPTSTPIISSSTPVTDDTVSDEARTYIYTYVNAIGEESAPSPASITVIVPTEGTTVELSGLDTHAEAADRNVSKKRIYRSLTGSSGNAIFLFAGEIDESATTFTDTLIGTALVEELQTLLFDTPRTGMTGLGLTAYGVAYGFINKIVCMSYPFYVYAWPRDFELTTQYAIVAMGHYDSNIVVATKGNPVMITGIDPIGGMSMTEIPLNEACVAKRSMVSLGYAVIYASPNGLVMASASGAQLISSSFFGKDEWQALNPESIHAVEHRGKYLFFWRVDDDNKGAYIFDPAVPDQGIIRLSLHCISTHRDLRTDTLYMLQEDGSLQRFDTQSVDRVPYVWRSKKFRSVSSRGNRLLCGQVFADTYNCLSLTIFADGDELYRQQLDDRPFRLPNHSHKKYWQIEISGTDIAREIVLAESLRELSN